MIDLHAHSTFSDGSLTPEDLVEEACFAGLSGIALTDHDTTDGVPRFLAACKTRGIAGVPGVEISVGVSQGTMHMLGYFVDPACPALEEALGHIRCGRTERNTAIVAALNRLGMPLTMEEASSYADEDVVGRPHIARAMVGKGYVSSTRQAFDRYLGKGKPAYADRFRLSPEESLGVIRTAGGVPVLSHPFTLGLKPDALRRQVSELAEKGLAGIEVYYPEHKPDLVAQYKALTEEFDLVMTGGSDFHGTLNPAISLGRGFGGLNVPDILLDRLRERKEALGHSAGGAAAAHEA
jgi:3',5'-nucleoside bisphosphate phosphatase